ncbi:MAG: DNA translocase FtsK 4TM domain-containing protein [Burkholderiales bacterium]|nr:DNA translocase FtsK 4TM domain-containing protein [Burkholderiales bacterium]
MFNEKTPKFATKNRATILPTKSARLINDITAVLLFAIALILAGMLLTYSGDDTCWFKSSDSAILHNKFGLLGSYIADIIFSIFGRSGWWLTFGIFYLGYRKIVRDSINTGNWYSIFQVISFIFLIISSSICEYFSLYDTPATVLHNGNGGMVGHLLYEYLARNVGTLPTTIFTLILVITSFSCAFSFSLLNLAEKIGLALEYLCIWFGSLFTNKSDSPLIKQNINSLESQDDDYSSILDKPLHHSQFNHKLPKARASKKIEPIILEPDVEDELELGIEKPHKFKRSIRLTNNGLPSTSLLNSPPIQTETISEETIEFVSMSIENKLAEFGVEAKIINAESGPVITRYELLPSRGVRGEKIVGLSKEIARGLALTNVRIVETIPGKNSMGIEVPNFKRKTIYLKEIFDSAVYNRNTSKLTLALGKDISGNVIVTDLAKMPHLLVAGTTGSGKSVAVNAMILSILFGAAPDEVKFIMIDPKMVELSFYQDIPHLLAPVVTDMTQAANALKWTVAEMERRYRIMAKFGCKNIISLNQKIIDAEADGVPLINPFSEEEEKKWAYIVVIIDELADLMMVTGKKIEQYIARIAQKARAVGIHLIVATQRPSVDVITGLIKANIPARISFQVSSKIDSRTILDQMGAETLLGQGDMLFLQPGSGITQRIHGAFVNDDELNKVVEFLKTTGTPEYLDDILTGGEDGGAELPGFEDESASSDTEKDPIFDEAVKFIYDSKRCSISSLQTRFGIGYNRAARIMAHLESIGLVKRNDRGGFELIKNSVN